MSETFIEIRCPACTKLGYDTSRLLFKVHYFGSAPSQDAEIEIRCHRCKSLILWNFGTPSLHIAQIGRNVV